MGGAFRPRSRPCLTEENSSKMEEGPSMRRRDGQERVQGMSSCCVAAVKESNKCSPRIRAVGTAGAVERSVILIALSKGLHKMHVRIPSNRSPKHREHLCPSNRRRTIHYGSISSNSTDKSRIKSQFHLARLLRVGRRRFAISAAQSASATP